MSSPASFLDSSVQLTLVTIDEAQTATSNVLVLYTDNPLVERWRGVVTVGVTIDVAIRLPSAAQRLHVRWYADIVTDDGTVAQRWMGGGASTIGSTTIDLIDVTGTLDAMVGLTYHAEPVVVRSNVVALPSNELATELVQRVQRAYDGLKHNRFDDIASVSVLLNNEVRQLPLLWFPLLATRMTFLTQSHALRVFRRLVQLAYHFAPSNVSGGQLLAETLSFPSIGWRYCTDTTPSGKYADCWSSLWTFPNPERAAFDCEDGAQACLELFGVLLKITVDARVDPLLALIQRLALNYAPWMAIGEVKHDDAYVLHCFMVLLPREGSGFNGPAINIETTEFGSGPWSKEAFDSTLATDEDEYAACSSKAMSSPKARIRSPVAMMHKQKQYGRMLALFGVDGERAQHQLLHTGDTLGVDTGAFLLNPRRFARKLVIDINTSELKSMLSKELALYPVSTLPLPSTVLALPKSRRCVLMQDGNEFGVLGAMTLGCL